MTWIVTGGAGYIGAHVAHAFLQAGMSVVVFDNLSSGHRSFLPQGVPFVEGDVCRRNDLDRIFDTYDVSGVIHLAGYKYAGESVRNPLYAYHQNVQGMITLLESMEAAEIRNIVFSSSAAVYGTAQDEWVTEQTALDPQSPYGQSKLVGEWMLQAQSQARGLCNTSFRYFNVVGSGVESVCDTSKYNLFPRIYDALDQGKAPIIYGADYDTSDGTCIRDYVHVADVAYSHVVAAKKLLAGEKLEAVYNLGSGTGYSVRNIMETFQQITQQTWIPRIASKRSGDPSCIIASGELAKRDVEWQVRYSLEEMVSSAWTAQDLFNKVRKMKY